MICERCGKDIPDSAAICPSCGTATLSSRSAMQPPTSYGQYQPGSFENPQPMPTYEQGYAPQQNYQPPQQPTYMPPRQNFGYAPQYGAPPMYQPGPVNVTIVNNATAFANKNTGALIAEIILSLFSIYGVGWLMAGETTIGTILLICSAVYWLFAFVFTIVTFGIGLLCLLCLAPLSIAVIIINALLLNSNLDRKARQFIVVPPQQMRMPPQ